MLDVVEPVPVDSCATGPTFADPVAKLENLSNVVVKGTKLSNAKTVEKLINDRVNNSDSRPPEGIINAKNQQEA